MGKLFTPQNVGAGVHSETALNTNFAAIEAAFDLCLALNGATPNSMSANVDMNSKRAINGADAQESQDFVTLAQLNAASIVATDLPSQAGNAQKMLGTDGSVTGWKDASGLLYDNTGAPNLSAVNVDAALDELDNEKAGLSLDNTLSGDNTISGDTLFSGVTTHESAYNFLSATAPTANNYVASNTRPITAYGAGVRWSLVCPSTNTATNPTLNIDGLGTKIIKRYNGSALAEGELLVGEYYELIYTGVEFRVLNLPARFRGAKMRKTTNQTISDSVDTTVQFSTIDYDTESSTSVPIANTTTHRLTVPADVTKVTIHARIVFVNNATGIRELTLYKNGTADLTKWPRITLDNTSATYDALTTFKTPPIEVTGGDYFTLNVYQTSGGALDLMASGFDQGVGIEFAMEIIE